MLPEAGGGGGERRVRLPLSIHIVQELLYDPSWKLPDSALDGGAEGEGKAMVREPPPPLSSQGCNGGRILEPSGCQL